MRYGHRDGFSLIELLVVISIIAVLIAILLPALAKARATAKLTICGSNVRQHSTAAHAYAADHDGFTPTNDNSRGSDGQNGSDFWAVLFAPYLTGGAELPRSDYGDKVAVSALLDAYAFYRCPALTLEDGELHYTANNGIRPPATHPARAVFDGRRGDLYEVRRISLDELQFSPSQTGYHLEVAAGSAANDNYNFYDMHSWSHTPFDYDGNGNGSARAIKPNDRRHDGYTTVSFLDGHAEQKRLDAADFPPQTWLYFDYQAYVP